MADAMRIELVNIPSGELTMGVPPVPANADITRLWDTGKQVKLRPFKLGRYPVTNGQYLTFVEETGADRPDNVDTEGTNAANQPVGGLSWEDADAYARWLAERTGLPYRLPTDSEWEYAARGGRESTIFPWGDEISAELCCYNNLPAPTPVGQYPPNGFGLYDMVGISPCRTGVTSQQISDAKVQTRVEEQPAEAADRDVPTRAQEEDGDVNATVDA